MKRCDNTSTLEIVYSNCAHLSITSIYYIYVCSSTLVSYTQIYVNCPHFLFHSVIKQSHHIALNRTLNRSLAHTLQCLRRFTFKSPQISNRTMPNHCSTSWIVSTLSSAPTPTKRKYGPPIYRQRVHKLQMLARALSLIRTRSAHNSPIPSIAAPNMCRSHIVLNYRTRGDLTQVYLSGFVVASLYVFCKLYCDSYKRKQCVGPSPIYKYIYMYVKHNISKGLMGWWCG